MFPDGRSDRSKQFDQPDYRALAQRLKHNKHLTPSLTRHRLWLEYLDEEPASGLEKYTYSQFCEGLAACVDASDLREVIGVLVRPGDGGGDHQGLECGGCPILCVRGFGLQVVRESVGVSHG